MRGDVMRQIMAALSLSALFFHGSAAFAAEDTEGGERLGVPVEEGLESEAAEEIVEPQPVPKDHDKDDPKWGFGGVGRQGVGIQGGPGNGHIGAKASKDPNDGHVAKKANGRGLVAGEQNKEKGKEEAKGTDKERSQAKAKSKEKVRGQAKGGGKR